MPNDFDKFKYCTEILRNVCENGYPDVSYSLVPWPNLEHKPSRSLMHRPTACFPYVPCHPTNRSDPHQSDGRLVLYDLHS
jgi:hypothetical protein